VIDSRKWCAMLKSRLLGAVGIVAVVGGLVIASPPTQVPTSSPVTVPPDATFDVTSVKPSDPNERNLLEVQPGGRLIGKHLVPRVLIDLAFRKDLPLRSDQIIGAPQWTETTFFNIEARTRTASELPPGSPFSSPALPGLLRSLLAERFHLVAHAEQRQGPIYRLKTLDKLGPGLRQSGLDCAVSGSGCTTTLIYGARATLTARGSTMQQVANALPRGGLERPVIDSTGLSGRFDFVLRWSKAQDQASALDPNTTDPYDVSLFTAIREQLGLKLESTTGPVDVLVIDHIEQPMPD
jgi:uncharacterized protein (TIGR03435 family)